MQQHKGGSHAGCILYMSCSRPPSAQPAQMLERWHTTPLDLTDLRSITYSLPSEWWTSAAC